MALANHLVRAAYLNGREWPPPRYGYVGPSFEQAKDLVWSYLKQYTQPIDGVRFLEGELAIVLPHNGAIIKLYGGMSAYERMRGMYFDGIVLDEYPLLQKTVFSTVVRPVPRRLPRLGRRRAGPATATTTSTRLRLRAMDDERWDVFLIPLSETGEEALAYAEAKELTQDMSADEYAPRDGVLVRRAGRRRYFAEALNALTLQNRVCAVPVDLAAPVITAWDLGVHDYCSIWWWQNVGREVHFIDYAMAVGKGLDHWSSVLREKAPRRRLRIPLPPPAARHRGARDLDAPSRGARPSPISSRRPSRSSPCRASARRGRHPRRPHRCSARPISTARNARPASLCWRRLPQERDGPAGAWARPALARRRCVSNGRRRLPPDQRPLSLHAQARPDAQTHQGHRVNEEQVCRPSRGAQGPRRQARRDCRQR